MDGPHMTGSSPVTSRMIVRTRRASSRRWSLSTASRKASTSASVGCVLFSATPRAYEGRAPMTSRRSTSYRQGHDLLGDVDEPDILRLPQRRQAGQAERRGPDQHDRGRPPGAARTGDQRGREQGHQPAADQRADLVAEGRATAPVSGVEQLGEEGRRGRVGGCVTQADGDADGEMDERRAAGADEDARREGPHARREEAHGVDGAATDPVRQRTEGGYGHALQDGTE